MIIRTWRQLADAIENGKPIKIEARGEIKEKIGVSINYIKYAIEQGKLELIEGAKVEQ